MSKVHRQAMSLVEPPVRAVFLDTTAGYETNVDAISAKAVEYYAHRLQTELRVASYRHARKASEAETARAVAEIRAANFLFAGPGSPTYAIEHWRGSPVWEAVVERFRGGAHLLFASAAAITLGRYALPVYEIYKAGRDPYWEQGLDLLGEYGLSLAIVPHFNDNSGGTHYDSRFCYMGAARFDELQALLPPEVTIFGIDEYTAAHFDADQQVVHVTGQGVATVIASGGLTRYGAGSAIPFARLASTSREVVPLARRAEAEFDYEFAQPDAPGNGLDELVHYVAELPLDAAARVELLARIEAASAASDRGRGNEARLLDLVLELREELRRSRQWELSDRAREALVQMGYEVRDTPEGSRWLRARS